MVNRYNHSLAHFVSLYCLGKTSTKVKSNSPFTPCLSGENTTMLTNLTLNPPPQFSRRPQLLPGHHPLLSTHSPAPVSFLSSPQKPFSSVTLFPSLPQSRRNQKRTPTDLASTSPPAPTSLPFHSVDWFLCCTEAY